MISGYLVARNAVENDYCIEACIKSLAHVCDEVVVGYCKSSDDTFDVLKEIGKDVKQLRVIESHHDWSVVGGGVKWMMELTESIRVQLSHPYQIQLGADEVLAEWCKDEIVEASSTGKALWCNRLNFWGSTKLISPDGMFCGHIVPQCGPSELVMPGDFGMNFPICELAVPSKVEIFHYSTLRKVESFVKKSKEFQMALCGTYDVRIDEATKTGNHWTHYFDFGKPLKNYYGKHPTFAHAWLRERGYNP